MGKKTLIVTLTDTYVPMFAKTYIYSIYVLSSKTWHRTFLRSTSV